MGGKECACCFLHGEEEYRRKKKRKKTGGKKKKFEGGGQFAGSDWLRGPDRDVSFCRGTPPLHACVSHVGV